MEGLDCHKCSSQMKMIRGCESEVNPYQMCGYRITRCPLRLVTNEDTISLQAFKEYRAGYLPNEGGWLDQPMKFSSIVSMIEAIVSRLEDRRQDGISRS